MTNNNEQIINIDPLLIDSFLRDGKKAVDTIGLLIEKSDFSNANNLQQLRITVHGVKSSLRSIGEAGLADDAGELEDAARNGDLDVISTGVAPFFTGLRSVVDKMQLTQAADIDGDDPPDLKKRLQVLKEMWADYDRRGALKIIADITVCTPETRVLLKAAKELIGQSDFEEAEA